MLIKKLKIQNLKVLHDFELDLSDDSDRLVFVNGFNNHGKTTLLRGIAFALFGTQVQASEVSEKTTREMEPGSTCMVSSIVLLELDDHSEAHISREQYFKKTEQGEIRQSGTPLVRVQVVDSDKSSVSKNMSAGEAEVWLEENFPSRFQHFIIFDGEEMEKFLDSGLNVLIERAVRQVANIDSFDSTIESLSKRKTRLEKELVKSSNQSDAEALLKRKHDAQRLFEAKEGEYKGLLRERDDLALELNQLKPMLDKQSELSALNERREAIKAEISTLEGVEKDLKIRLNETQWNVGIKSFLTKYVEKDLSEEIQRAVLNKWYPTKFRHDVLEELIESGICVCGRAIDSESSQQIHRHIERNLKAKGDGEILDSWERSLETTKAVLNADTETRDKQRDLTLQNSIDLNNAKGRYAEAEAEFRRSGASGGESDFVLHFSNTQRRHDQIVDNLLENAKTALEIAEQAKRQADSDYESMVDRSGLSGRLRREINFLERVISESKNFGESILNSIRKELEDYLSEHVQDADQDRYRTYIDDDFQLQTVTAESERKVNLSEGQKMMRAYFFSFALRSVVELNLPLIVDSPLMRLDGKNTKRMVSALGKVFGGPHGSSQQAMFMMTDKEYSPKVRELFAKSFPIAPRETYLWHHNQNPEFSELREGIDPDWFLEEFGPWYGQKVGH